MGIAQFIEANITMKLAWPQRPEMKTSNISGIKSHFQV
jgi:hypothetical protein